MSSSSFVSFRGKGQVPLSSRLRLRAVSPTQRVPLLLRPGARPGVREGQGDAAHLRGGVRQKAGVHPRLRRVVPSGTLSEMLSKHQDVSSWPS